MLDLFVLLILTGSHIAVAIERDLRTDLDFSKCNYEMADFLRKLPDLALFNNFRALMKTIWKAWMPKQCLSIYDQLVAGARYLDMRVTKLSGQLYGEHGLYARPLKAYLRDVRRFVEEHTSEVVILHFQVSRQPNLPLSGTLRLCRGASLQWLHMLKTDAARITRLNIEMFHEESKGQGHGAPKTLSSWFFALL